MSGHSHWSGIKHQKDITDKKRAITFSKLLVAISAAAKTEPDPNFNPRLRSAIEKAKEASVPAENITRAIKRATESDKKLEELLFEAYGPGGIALLILAVSDSPNRTVQEIKKILNDHSGKLADPGSVSWAFTFSPTSHEWTPKFPLEISENEMKSLEVLTEALLDQADTQDIYTNNQ